MNLNIIGQFCQPEHAEHYAEHHAEQSQHHDIRVNVRSCLGSWLHKAPLSNILCQFGGAIHKVNYPQQHCLTFFHIIGVGHGVCGKHLFSREFATRRIHA